MKANDYLFQHMLTYKHNESNSFVHVQNNEFYLSKGLFDQYYFRFVPMNPSIQKLFPIHRDSELYMQDKEFNSIISAFIQVLLQNHTEFNPHKILEENNYSLVDTYKKSSTRNAVLYISKLPYINDQNYLDTVEWIHAGTYELNDGAHPLYVSSDSLVAKYDSLDSNKGMYSFAVIFPVRFTDEIFVDDDSIFNIELPYSQYGNLINSITIDEDGHCINQEEYDKYIALSKYMVFPKLEERKPR